MRLALGVSPSGRCAADGFSDGLSEGLSDGAVRLMTLFPSCSWGGGRMQMRHYTIVTTDSRDASLYLTAGQLEPRYMLSYELGGNTGGQILEGSAMPLSTVHVRRNKRPTPSAYDMAIRAPVTTLSTSPCYVDDPYEYHIRVALDTALRATAEGLPPTLFAIRPQLLSAEGPT